MWVKGIPLHFVVDNGSHKSLISTEVVKILELSKTPHPQPYNISRLRQGWGIHINQQRLLPYGIKPFKEEVLCDVAPLELCDVLLGQPYMPKHHAIYDSWPCNVIVTLGGQLYRILETVSPYYREKPHMAWGYINRQYDTRNQSFPICKSNKQI